MHPRRHHGCDGRQPRLLQYVSPSQGWLSGFSPSPHHQKALCVGLYDVLLLRHLSNCPSLPSLLPRRRIIIALTLLQSRPFPQRCRRRRLAEELKRGASTSSHLSACLSREKRCRCCCIRRGALTSGGLRRAAARRGLERHWLDQAQAEAVCGAGMNE